MNQRVRRNTGGGAADASALAPMLRQAVSRGLTVGRSVRIGVVQGIVIGYNIARQGRFPGERYPLLVETELGVGKFRLDEVVPA